MSDDEEQLLLSNTTDKSVNEDDDAEFSSSSSASGSDDDSSSSAASASSSDDDDDDDDDDDVPLAAKKKPAPKPKAKGKAVRGKKQVKIDESQNKEDDGAGDANDDDGDDDGGDEETRAWYEDNNVQLTKKGDKRWKTLLHNGPMFPDEYVPHGVTIDYNGVEFKLRPDEEELVTAYATMRNATQYYRKPLFQANFFHCLITMLDKNRGGRDGHPVRNLGLINFDRIWEWSLAQKAIRDARPNAEKKKERDATKKATLPYEYCYWDGRKERVSNFRVEPPGLFRGRGEHPKQGIMKRRIRPEDIVINIGEGEKVPDPPAGHRWKEVIHDHTVTWLAMWHDTVTGGTKYIMLHQTSGVKGASDREKFEKARKLKNHIGAIRDFYRAAWESGSGPKRQLGVAMYFIDKLALRVGNEKSDEEADTVGCCSLRVEHVLPLEPERAAADGEETIYKLRFDFLGKDSIRYLNDVPVERRVYELIDEFRRGKGQHEMIFNHVDSSDLNDKFKEFMDGLTAKVFRTYNASYTLEQELLRGAPKKTDSVDNKMLHFTHANTQVAVLCNHQKTVSKGHDQSMANMHARKEELVRLRDVCEECEEMDDLSEARAHFLEKHVEAVDQWMEAFGTDEEKEKWKEEREEYQEQIENMGDGGGKKKASPKKKKKSSSSPKKKKAASPSKKRSAAVKKRGRAEDREEEDSDNDESDDEDEDDDDDDDDSDDDVPLISKISPKKPSPKAKKPSPKRKAAAAAAAPSSSSDDDEDEDDDVAASDDSEDDDDEEDVGARRGGKKSRSESGRNSATPGSGKKGKKQPEPDSEEDNDDEDEDSDDDDEDDSEEDATPSKKKKKPAAKAKKTAKKAAPKQKAAGKKKSSPKKSPAKKPAAKGKKGKK